MTQLIKFFAVGILNTIVGYAFYAVFVFIGLDYKLSLLMATIIGVFFNFKTIGSIVFQNKNNAVIFRFIFVYFLVYLANVLIVGWLIDLGANHYLAGGIAIIPSALLAFILNKYFVFEIKGKQ